MKETLKTQLERGELTAGSNISFWTDSIVQQNYPKLADDVQTDAVIIGGGNAGLTIAYQLLKKGIKTVVVEDGFVGSGESGRTSAHLTAALDSRYFELQNIYGKEKCKLIAESHMNGIRLIENIVKAENIQCDFERLSGYLFLHETDIHETLSKELKTATEAGLDVVWHDTTPYIKNTAGPCLEFKNQAKFHPLKYLMGLADVIVKMGGQIYSHTHAKDIDRDGVTSREGFRINAKHIIVATNAPVNNKFLMHLRQYPYRTYVIGACVKKDAVADVLLWDTGNQKEGSSFAAYHYVRTIPYNEEYDLLICGGEDHPTGLIDISEPSDEKSKYNALEQWARKRFPIEAVQYEWSGQVIYSFDALGHIGRNPMDKDNIYIVTGDCGNGLTYGAIAGILVPDLITENKNEYEDLYRPSRFKFLKAGKVFIEELFSGLAAYFKTKNLDSAESIFEIRPGEGKIMEIKGKKYGVSRGYDDCLDVVSAECTHLGCIMNWNPDETSWDCPCHGSRFTNTGVVINGPANYNLNHYKIMEEEFENLKTKIK